MLTKSSLFFNFNKKGNMCLIKTAHLLWYNLCMVPTVNLDKFLVTFSVSYLCEVSSCH